MHSHQSPANQKGWVNFLIELFLLGIASKIQFRFVLLGIDLLMERTFCLIPAKKMLNGLLLCYFPEGGLYTWLTMQEGIDLVDIAPRAASQGVTYDLGTTFAVGDDPGRNKARLCFSYNNEVEIREGITRLANIIKSS